MLLYVFHASKVSAAAFLRQPGGMHACGGSRGTASAGGGENLVRKARERGDLHGEGSLDWTSSDCDVLLVRRTE